MTNEDKPVFVSRDGMHRVQDEYFYVGIVPSKHLYFTKDRQIRRQKKTHDISIENFSEWRKPWLIYHLVAGSRSGRFALQILDKPDPVLLANLFSRCVDGTQDVIVTESKYGDHILTGRPKIGSVVPKALHKLYPSIAQGIQDQGCVTFHAAKGAGFRNPIVHLTRTLNDEVLHQANPYDIDKEDFISHKFDDEDILSGVSDIIAEIMSLRSRAYLMWGWICDDADDPPLRR